MNFKNLRGLALGLAVAASACVAAVHFTASNVRASFCSPVIPVDKGQVCLNQARVGVTPDMVANAELFAKCIQAQGVTPPVVLHDPYSITFQYLPGVVPSSTVLAYCHANAPRLPIPPITPPQFAPPPVSVSPPSTSAKTAASARAAGQVQAPAAEPKSACPCCA